MAKNKKVGYNPKKALKFFSYATYRAIEDELRNVNVDDLITDIFLTTKDKEVETLLKIYEKQLILYKLNPQNFEEGLHDFFMETHQFIKENKLFKKFFQLVNEVYIALDKKGINRKVFTAYNDLLIQQYAYFGGGTKYVAYGVKDNDDLLIMSEIGQYLSEINYELNKAKGSNDMHKTFAKYGYKTKNLEDVQKIIAYDQVITNMLYQMTFYINEHNTDLIPKPFYNPNTQPLFNPLFKSTKRIEQIKERLTKRQNLLPTNGLIAKYKNMIDVTELFMKEEIINDVVILLYKVKFKDNTYTFGFYDTFNKVFYDMWRDSTYDEIVHKPLENFVLHTYMSFTCNLSEEEKEQLMLFNEVNNLDIETFLPLVKYEIKEDNPASKTGHRNFNKNEYQTELRHIQPFLRNLPVGASASNESITLAKKMGIELPVGKTFVKDFRKKVYTK